MVPSDLGFSTGINTGTLVYVNDIADNPVRLLQMTVPFISKSLSRLIVLPCRETSL